MVCIARKQWEIFARLILVGKTPSNMSTTLLLYDSLSHELAM